tara:strand:- start:33442 stop:34398 length:957 start_codon:yes stop_codon:yes gene_type:complete
MESNLRLEREFIASKSITVNDFILENISESQYISMLKESCDELGIEYDNQLNEERGLITEEGFTLMAISAALASGKLFDLIGSFFRKAWNFISKQIAKKSKTCKEVSKDERGKCAEALLASGKGPKILGKTWFEKAGEWIHENIIMTLFRVVAIVLLDTAQGIFSSGKKSDEVQQDYYGGPKGTFIEGGKWVDDDKLVDMVANTLFYATITIVGYFGLKELYALGKDGIATFTGVVEIVTSVTKGYELILLVIATVVIKRGLVKSSDTSGVAHTLGECLEGGGKIGKIFKQVKKMKKDDSYSQEVLACLNKSLELAHH